MLLISQDRQRTIIVEYDSNRPISKFTATKKLIFRGIGKFIGKGKKKKEKGTVVGMANRKLEKGEREIQMQMPCIVVNGGIKISVYENNKLTEKMLKDIIGETSGDLLKLIYPDGKIPKINIIQPGTLNKLPPIEIGH